MKHLTAGFLIVILLFTACNPSKQYVKKGDELYAMGLYEDAANYYYNALLANPKNYLAKQALEKAGNLVLTSKISQFGRYIAQNETEQAVYQYRNAQRYFNTVKNVGVELNWPSLYNDVYEDLKSDFVLKLYDKGLAQMQQKKYDLAEKTFSKITELDSNFKDVTVLRTISLLEPMYARGNQLMGIGNYKEAYRNFDKVFVVDPTFKDIAALRNQALEKARTGVVVVGSAIDKSLANIAQQTQDYLVANLVKIKNPFLQVVDRKFFNQFLQEQELGMTGIINPESAAKAGKLAGLKYVLAVRVNDYKVEDLPLKTDSVVAYEAYTESTPNPNGTYNYVTRFKKVNYADAYQKRLVSLKVFYELISTETSAVVASDIIDDVKIDEQHVFTYNGSPKNLYPNLPAGNFLPEAPKEWRANFTQLRRRLVSIDELQRNALAEIALRISAEINVYIDK